MTDTRNKEVKSETECMYYQWNPSLYRDDMETRYEKYKSDAEEGKSW